MRDSSLHCLPFGVYAELVTPFWDGSLDRVGLMGLIDWQIRGGVSGILVCGEAGEASTLTMDERAGVIGCALEAVDGEMPVLAGTGTNSTEQTVTLTRQAEALGVTAAVVVTPYYSKPTQEGMFRHFEAVAHAVNIPLLIANAPQKTAVDIRPELMERLIMLPNVLGVIDYSGDLSRRAQFPEAGHSHIRHFTGHDRISVAFGLLGGHGGFSMMANIAPRLAASMHHALRGGNVPAALALQQRLMPLMLALEAEHPVAATKFALSLILGLSPQVRLPLLPVSRETEDAMREALLLLGDRMSPHGDRGARKSA